MSRRKDLTGAVFGRMVVVEYSHTTKQGEALWRCRCSCGGVKVARGSGLRNGTTTSCGCYQKEVAAAVNTSHGLRQSSEYQTWNHMRQRCSNPKDGRYSDYGGRGIVVCESWSSFEQFYADMGPRPSKDHTLDRKDNNGNYCKENCRWATRKEQNTNQRSNVRLTHNGETLVLSEWAEKSGIPYKTLHQRIARGWGTDRAITQPVKQEGRSL